MKLLTTNKDDKINADNHLFEISIREYASIAKEIIYNNDLQRKRVKTSNRTYVLLKDDIKHGCVIPPIVLAIFTNVKVVDADKIANNFRGFSNDLIILDGLQRTYTILDLLEEVGDEDLSNRILELPLRVEIYTGISKVGVLYRMLTLNTGQTPMSTRHQIEILYSEYKNGINGLDFITEADSRQVVGDNEYRFNDVLDCFLSYITGDYFPIQKEDIIAIIKNLESLTKDDKQEDIFISLINLYHKLKIKVNELAPDWKYGTRENKVDKIFASSINELFTKVQFLAGFGGALSSLVKNSDNKKLQDFNDIVTKIDDENIMEGLDLIIEHLDNIRTSAKKIGNEQRMYCFYLLRGLLNEVNDCYLNLFKSADQAYSFYKANAL